MRLTLSLELSILCKAQLPFVLDAGPHDSGDARLTNFDTKNTYRDCFVDFGQFALSDDKNGLQIRILLTQEIVPIPVTFFLAKKK